MDWLVSRIQSVNKKEFGFLKQDADLDSEPHMDCQSCVVHAPLKRSQPVSKKTKCCDFNPFVSGFAIGTWLHEGGAAFDFLNWTRELGVMTRLGVAQPRQRNTQERPRCQFYLEDQKGKCAIWSQRPSICRSYFCAHSSHTLFRARQHQEKTFSELEAQLLMQWFDEQGGLSQDWQMWVEYMETPYGGKLAPSFVFHDHQQALAHYLEMADWLDATISA